HGFLVVAELEFAVDQIHPRAQPFFVQLLDLVARERLEEDVGQGRPAPERERILVDAASLVVITAREEPTAFGYEVAEASGVEGAGVYVQDVAGRTRRDGVGFERTAELGDVRLNDLRGGRRGLFTPELVDQALVRDDLVRMEQQHPEERPHLRGVKRSAVMSV